MAEWLSPEDADGKYQKKANGKINAGLTLGIIGTALGALNGGLLGGNGILGLGGSRSGASYAEGAATMAAGTALGGSLMGRTQPTAWEVEDQEVKDQEFDLVRMGQIEADSLRTAMATREMDVKEKASLFQNSINSDITLNTKIDGLKDFTIQGLSDVYQASVTENRNLENKIAANKDFTVQGLSDVYQASVAENRVLERQMNSNQLEAYKGLSNLYATTVTSDKNLELQIEKNREVDQAEKFNLYKDLSGQTGKLAFDSMKQSYENRLESMNQISALATRVCQLEKNEAVTAAQLPLMFKLTETGCNSYTDSATCKKIDGNLTIDPRQICNPAYPPISPFVAAQFTSTGCCGNTTTA